MILRVDFEQFAESAQRVLKDPVVAVASHLSGTRITASESVSDVIVSTISAESSSKVTEILKKAGLDVIQGEWVENDDRSETAGVSIAAVAYKSHESKPGLWVEAFGQEPSKPAVLRAIYDEFCETGELENTSLEEFLENTHPNVVILSSEDIRRFLDSRNKRS